MPSLIQGYRLGHDMGRKPGTVRCDHYDRTVLPAGAEFGGDCVCIRGEVVGGSQPYSVTIVIDNPKPHQPMYKPMSLKRLEKARWHCSCEDFQFRFWPHFDANGLALFPVVVEEGRGTGTPVAIQDFGMCKHVMAVVNRLVEDRVVSPFS